MLPTKLLAEDVFKGGTPGKHSGTLAKWHGQAIVRLLVDRDREDLLTVSAHTYKASRALYATVINLVLL